MANDRKLEAQERYADRQLLVWAKAWAWLHRRRPNWKWVTDEKRKPLEVG